MDCYYENKRARASFLDTEMKIQIRAPNKFTNKITSPCMDVAAKGDA